LTLLILEAGFISDSLALSCKRTFASVLPADDDF
jgi:hypothetical protein